MFKLIVTLTAAATSVIGQFCVDETKPVVQKPVRKEITNKKEIIIKTNQSPS